ncbi:MAG: sigma-54-dependent Fis family transcriptional regulator [Nitrospirae bacterium]|nr:sigma-54-dependent Fis family transcriptional regulator [Nitrospirota bacterium]MBF0542207.1 sigma-54-dependent Fis family transcriptional regulator [Nitrospirota bacterium]
MKKEKILIIEDEVSINNILVMLLEGEGYQVFSAFDGREGMDCIQKDIFDLIITDIKMPHYTGFDILKEALELSPDTVVIMITAFGTTEAAINALKLGAYDYINKPFKIDEIRLVVEKALEKRRLSLEVKNLRLQVEDRYRLGNMVGRSKLMIDLFSNLPKIAKSNASVLILGQSGCGKELFAHAIHNLSPRSQLAFVAINCAAMPEGLLESELFGHMKGSFTGAVSNKEGLFEVADNGTLFLDEIGDMPLNLQSKLLRVLEDGVFRRIGGVTDIKVDVRVISATNKDLQQALVSGNFRQDLFYRLNVIPVTIPPLCERKEDIPVLIDFYLEKNRITNRKFTKEAVDALVCYKWQGNVRELENTLERVLTISENSIINIDDLPSEIISAANKTINADPPLIEFTEEGIFLDRILEEIERKYLQLSLDNAHGNKTKAASLLNISFRQFRHRLKKYDLE